MAFSSIGAVYNMSGATRKAPATFPMTFENFEGRKEMNLRVLNRICNNAVQDYDLVIPETSVYVARYGKWERLQVCGPLFVVRMKNNPERLLFVLNNGPFKNVKDFQVIVPRTAKVKLQGIKLYIQIDKDSLILIAADCEADALQLYHDLTHDDDPTFKHLKAVLGL